ncbi:MAG: hypothetical protein Q8O14_07480 [bacterium]|nr:hypothetical protein [bacterium]
MGVWSWSVALLLLLVLSGGRARAAMEHRWLTLGGGLEAARYADEDPFRFQRAKAFSSSLFGSAGAGERWLAAAGWTDQRLRQEGSAAWLEEDGWEYRGLQRTLWLTRAVTPGWGVEALGHGSSTRLAWTEAGRAREESRHGWLVGGGLSWSPHPATGRPLVLGIRLARLRPAHREAEGGRIHVAELNLRRPLGAGSGRIALLATRSEEGLKLAGLARGAAVVGAGRLGLHASLLAGRLDHWYDVERLVVHDGPRPLRAAIGVGLDFKMGAGWSLSAATGWERVEDHESRWLYLGTRWSRQIWAVVP